MISEKMLLCCKNSSAIRAMFEEGKQMAKIHGADNVYDFSIGNPSVEPPPAVKNAIIRLLEEESPNYLHGYTSNAGYEDVRSFVADVTNREFGTKFSMENVIMSTGAAGGLNVVLKTLLNPGDEVIVFAPFFGEYSNYVMNYDGVLRVVSADCTNFQMNLSELEATLSPKTKAVLINTPNNPTGVVYSSDTLKSLASLLEEKQTRFGTSIYLISDEPYRKLVYDGVEVPFVTNYYKNTFVAYSFSKSLSLPGERIGYTIVNNDMDDFEAIINAMSVATRILGFVNAPSLFQRILPYCMEEKADVLTYENNRNLLYNMLTEIGFECIKPSGAFYMFPKTLIADDRAFCEEAKQFRILSAPGTTFGCPGYFRLSYCVSSQTIENAYESFCKLYQKYKG